MDRKTEQSAEFGALSAEREVFSTADMSSDGRTEFNAPEDGFRQEQAGSDPTREILGQGDPAETNRQTERKIRRRRNLLLQMAAAGMSVVVVTSSMGVDLLGSNALFGGDTPPIQDEGGIGGPGDEWVEEDVSKPDTPWLPDGSSWLRISAADEVHLLHEDPNTGEWNIVTGDLAYQVYYEPYTNILTLKNYADKPLVLQTVEAYGMGSDFTVFVEDPEGYGVTVGQLLSYGSEGSDDGSVTISGTEGSVLHINPDFLQEIGLYLDAGGGFSRIWISKEPVVNIRGMEYAVLARDVDLGGGILREEPYVICSGTIARMENEAAEEEPEETGSGVQSNIGSIRLDLVNSWSVFDENGEIATDVIFRRDTAPLLEGLELPDTGEAAYRRLSVTLSKGAEPVILSDFVLDDTAEVEGLSYDKETNTLTLTNFVGEQIRAERMGPDFVVYLRGDSNVGQILTEALLSTDNADLIIRGDNGATMTVNGNRDYPVGILVAAGGSPSRFAVEWGIDMDVYGTSAAVLVADTHRRIPNGIEVGEYMEAGGYIVQGEYAGETTSFTTDWTISEYRSLAAGTAAYIVSGRGG